MQGPGTYHYMLSRGGEEEKENRDRDGGKEKQLGDELVLLLLLLHTEARINVTFPCNSHGTGVHLFGCR